MARITQVTLGRVGHYRLCRLYPDISAIDAALCECGAEWHRDLQPDTTSFCDWALDHQTPTITRATVLCAGSNTLVHECSTDGDGVGWCSVCKRNRPTDPEPGYDGWRHIGPHPVFTSRLT